MAQAYAGKGRGGGGLDLSVWGFSHKRMQAIIQNLFGVREATDEQRRLQAYVKSGQNYDYARAEYYAEQRNRKPPHWEGVTYDTYDPVWELTQPSYATRAADCQCDRPRVTRERVVHVQDPRYFDPELPGAWNAEAVGMLSLPWVREDDPRLARVEEWVWRYAEPNEKRGCPERFAMMTVGVDRASRAVDVAERYAPVTGGRSFFS